MRVLHFFLKTLLVAAPLWTASAALADNFPSVGGVWAGTYKMAFPSGHPTYPDKSVDVSMELEVYRQESNLIWVINRWRLSSNDPWIVEYGTGSFNLDERSDLAIGLKGPPPEEWTGVGSFIGEFDDGKLYLNYVGQGDGTSFAVELQRKAN